MNTNHKIISTALAVLAASTAMIATANAVSNARMTPRLR